MDLDFGRFFQKGREYLVIDNYLNEMACYVSVVNAVNVMGVIPGPRHPSGPEWGKEADFEVL